MIGENEIKAAKGLKYKFEKFRSDDDVEDDPGDKFVEGPGNRLTREVSSYLDSTIMRGIRTNMIT